MKKALLYLSFILSSISLYGQPYEVIASGIVNPTGIALDDNGNLYIAETGSGNDDGRILFITPSHQVCPLVTGLPSNQDMGSVSGPYRIYILPGGIMKVLIGEGFSAIEGCMLTFDISSFRYGHAPFTFADTLDMLPIRSWVLTQDYYGSNPYSVAWDGAGNTFVADASANLVVKIDAARNYSILTTFPRIPLNYPNFQPLVDYVPTIILNNPEGGFYIGNLTGWPFPTGRATVIKMDADGNTTPYAEHLSMIADMEADAATGDLFALQYAFFDTAMFYMPPGSASIVRISSSGAVDTMVTGFGPSAGMVNDGAGGYYVTCQYAGTVIHIPNVITGSPQPGKEPLDADAYPNPFSKNVNVQFWLKDAMPVHYTLSDISGRLISSTSAGMMNKGLQHIACSFQTEEGRPVSAGIYLLTLHCGKEQCILKLVAR